MLIYAKTRSYRARHSRDLFSWVETWETCFKLGWSLPSTWLLSFRFRSHGAKHSQDKLSWIETCSMSIYGTDSYGTGSYGTGSYERPYFEPRQARMSWDMLAFLHMLFFRRPSFHTGFGHYNASLGRETYTRDAFASDEQAKLPKHVYIPLHCIALGRGRGSVSELRRNVSASSGLPSRFSGESEGKEGFPIFIGALTKRGAVAIKFLHLADLCNLVEVKTNKQGAGGVRQTLGVIHIFHL